MTRHIGVPLDDYEKLVRDQAELNFLYQCGVDNWEWYDEAMDLFSKWLDEHKKQIENGNREDATDNNETKKD